MKKVRVGLIGAGFAARFHADCYRRVSGIEVELSGVVAAHPEHARRFADEFHVARAHPTATELLADPAIRVEDVAARLKVSPATLYRHLPGGRSAVLAKE